MRSLHIVLPVLLLVGLAPVCHAQLIDANSHSAHVIGPGGQCYSWGWDIYGSFGLGTTNFVNRCTPTPSGIPNAVQISQVSPSEMMALDDAGNVWQWGQTIGTPYMVSGLSNIVAIEAAAGARFAIDNTGQLYAWGGNHVGQLGLGFTSGSEPVTAVPGMTNIVKVGGAMEHVLAIDATGQAFGWGRNPLGQLGLGTTASNVPTPTPIPGMTNTVDVTGGWFHSFILDASGQVYAMGRASSHELGLGSTADQHSPTPIPGLTNIVEIGAQSIGGFAVDNTGQMFAWGQNQFGQTGTGTTGGHVTIPTACPGMTDVVEVATEGWQPGENLSICRDSSGNVYMAGRNNRCQLGQGATGADSNLFIQVLALPPVQPPAPPVYTLTIQQSVFNGDVDVIQTNGPANATYFTVYTGDPTNAGGGLGSGWWGGLHIPFSEIVTFTSIPYEPIQGTLDANGEASYTIAAGTTAGASGVTIYAVTHAFQGPGFGALLDVTDPIEFTFL